MLLPALIDLQYLPDLFLKCKKKQDWASQKQYSVEVQKVSLQGAKEFHLLYFGKISSISAIDENQFLLRILSMKAKENLNKNQNQHNIIKRLGTFNFLKLFQEAEQNYDKTTKAFLQRFAMLTKINRSKLNFP